MSREVIDRSPCLQKLQNEGFKLEVRGAYLLVHHVPYLNENAEVKDGILAMPVCLSGLSVSQPGTHIALWIGEVPYRVDGQPYSFINDGLDRPNLGGGLVVNHAFSCMPDAGMYKDYYEKVTYYCRLLSGPAEKKDSNACEKIRRLRFVPEGESPFLYPDSNSSRAGIVGLDDIFLTMKIAIIGLGGTGSYLLDKLVKSPVKEIHLFDDDVFMNHNAFRAPGAASLSELEVSPKKVDYFAGVYSKMRTGIFTHPMKITPQNASLLEGLDFVFICVDSRDARESIANALIQMRIPFIDSGLGAGLSNGKLLGIVRTTLSFGANYSHLKHCFASDGSSDDIYSTNIQIAELNSIAADFAIIRWKRFVGYYADEQFELNSLFSFSGNILTNRKNE